MPKEPFYITKEGRIKRQHNTVRFEHEDGHVFLPIEQIDAIYVLSSLDMNTKLIEFFNYKQIPIHFFNYHGNYTGSFMPRDSMVSGTLIIKQALASQDLSERIPIAKEFLRGASANMMKNVRQFERNHNAVQALVYRMEKEIHQLQKATEITELMGIEGNIRKIYYQLIDDVMVKKNRDYVMDGRIKRPPNNKMNALVSFINGMVYATTVSEIYHTQLHPAISFLHEPTERRFSLALDISEIFKPLLTDRLIFKLINLNMLSKRSFDQAEGVCYLSEDGRKKVIEEYYKKLKTTVKHRTLGKHVSYRRLIRLECYNLIKHLLGDKVYTSFKIWW